MAKICDTDINNLNNTIYTIGTKAKLQTALPSNLQSSSGNNVTDGNKITNVNIETLKTAIKTLQTKFSNNCCQNQCNSTSTISSCQITTYAATCQKYVTKQCATKQCYTSYSQFYCDTGF